MFDKEIFCTTCDALLTGSNVFTNECNQCMDCKIDNKKQSCIICHLHTGDIIVTMNDGYTGRICYICAHEAQKLHKSKQSASDYCRICKCVLRDSEESTCKYCVINMARK